ncbi:MAG TPA: site-specific DNA-methyltransferase [Terriglobales bacterium]|nr:site-specific DNA-methyltransferase [Terriglobales bacterium]
MPDVAEAEALQTDTAPRRRETDPELFFSRSGIDLYLADARAKLSSFGEGTFQTCVTSPPYWGLRDYDFQHQIGAENTVDEYIADLVSLFRNVRRTLREDGTFWLNIGDAYTSGGRTWRAPDKKNAGRAMSYRPDTPKGLKPKDLIGLPWKLAFALQADGWFLRSDIIWQKPNCQPESVKDRPTRCHEYIFLFSKTEHYFYDPESVQEDAIIGTGRKNRRSVWSINTEGFKGAHFAVFPPKLVELCILAGAPSGSCVLDPFFGTGTVGLVSKYLRRRCVGIEMKREFAEMAMQRIKSAPGKARFLPLS